MKQYILSFFLLLGFAGSSFAQSPALYDLNTSLEGVIKKMQKAKNGNFILVQAYKDGLLKEGEPYEFKYAADVIFIDGKELPEYEQQKYRQMYKEVYGKRAKSMYSSVRSGGMKVEQIFDRESSLWYPHGCPIKTTLSSNEKQRKKVIKLITKNMEDDGLMPNPNKYSISFDLADGVKLNGQRPPEQFYKKYERFCIVYIGHQPVNGNDRFSHSVNISRK